MGKRVDFQRALEEISGKDASLSPATLQALSDSTRDEGERFAACLCALDGAQRCDIVQRMVTAAEESFALDYAVLFRHCLSDADSRVRRLAIEGLWEDQKIDLLRRLLTMVREDDVPAVRAAAATSLGRYVLLAELDELDQESGRRVQRELKRVAGDPNEDLDTVRRAIESLGYVNDSEVERLIGWAYDHDNSKMRASAVYAMGRSADPIWAESVLIELEARSPVMRFEAARAAGELQLNDAVSLLVGLTSDSDREVQGMAIWALGQIGGDVARQLLESLADGDDAVAAAAADEALSELAFAMGGLDLMVVDPAAQQMIEVDPREVAGEHSEDWPNGDDDATNDDVEDDWADDPIELS